MFMQHGCSIILKHEPTPDHDAEIIKDEKIVAAP
jgi:hypothetical protein